MTAAPPPADPVEQGGRGTVGEVFLAFLRLGLTSFGGPVAHLGYFRHEFVQRRRWLTDTEYGDVVAVSQFLPGPASSQTGFALGLLRAGGWGALAAFAAFTLPSAVLMVLFAWGADLFAGPVVDGLIAGLLVVAVAVVAQAVWGMARTLTPDARRASIAVVAAAVVLLPTGPLGQVVAILLGALGGLLLCRGDADDMIDRMRYPVSRVVGVVCLALFGALLVALPIAVALAPGTLLAIADAGYRSGALVFGGGHVVLPLLESAYSAQGLVDADAFLAGYGAAQAVPGPLFTLSAYLGAVAVPGPAGLLAAAVSLVAIFLPGFLLLVGVLPFWDAVRRRPLVRAAARGLNAAVVGILGAALYDPVFTTAITGVPPLVLAIVCFVLLTAWRLPSWAVVLVGAAGGVALTVLGPVVAPLLVLAS